MSNQSLELGAESTFNKGPRAMFLEDVAVAQQVHRVATGLGILAPGEISPTFISPEIRQYYPESDRFAVQASDEPGVCLIRTAKRGISPSLLPAVARVVMPPQVREVTNEEVAIALHTIDNWPVLFGANQRAIAEYRKEHPLPEQKMPPGTFILYFAEKVTDDCPTVLTYPRLAYEVPKVFLAEKTGDTVKHRVTMGDPAGDFDVLVVADRFDKRATRQEVLAVLSGIDRMLELGPNPVPDMGHIGKTGDLLLEFPHVYFKMVRDMPDLSGVKTILQQGGGDVVKQLANALARLTHEHKGEPEGGYLNVYAVEDRPGVVSRFVIYK